MLDAHASLRAHVDVLWGACEKKQTGTKTKRHKAITAIHELLSKKSVIHALTGASRVEMMKRTQQDDDSETVVLAWAELTSIVVDAVDKACTEAKNAKSVSRSGVASLKPEYMTCLRSVITNAIRYGPSGVIRHITPVFLYFSHEWLAEPTLRSIIADQVWQLVKDILEDEANRAMLTPKYIRLWVDVCFEQLTGRGPMHRKSQVVTNIASKVLQLLSKPVPSYDILTQGTRGVSTSKMRGGDYSFAMICERCCLMLVIADSIPRREARELQATSFLALTQLLQNHAVTFIGSSALTSIINVSLKPILSCWTDRKYHEPAVSLAKVLILLTPNHGELKDALRRRFVSDLKDQSSSAVRRAGLDIRENFVITAATVFSLAECIDFIRSSPEQKGHLIVWLRVTHSIVSRRVLKIGTSILVRCDELQNQIADLVLTITAILKEKLFMRETKYGEVIRWVSRTIQAVCQLTQKIEGNLEGECDLRIWQHVYKELWNHASRAKSQRTSRVDFSARDVSHDWYDSLVHTLSILHHGLLFGLSSFVFRRTADDGSGRLQYPFSKITENNEKPSCGELEYLRNVIATNGLPEYSGTDLRKQMLDHLLAACEIESIQCERSSERLMNVSCAVLGLSRGGCLMVQSFHQPHLKDIHDAPYDMDNLFYLNAFFSLNVDGHSISGNGPQMCVDLGQAMQMWNDKLPQMHNIMSFLHVLNEAPTGSLRGRRQEIRRVRGNHFPVDPKTTRLLEASFLRKICNSLMRESTTPSNDSRDKISASYDIGNLDIIDEETCEKCFNTEGDAVRGIKWVIVLSTYFLQGLELGLLLSSYDACEQETSAITKLKNLLVLLLRRLCLTSSFLLILHSDLTESMMSVLVPLMQHIETESKRKSLIRNGVGYAELGKTILQSIKSMGRNFSEQIMHAAEKRMKEIVKTAESDDYISSHSFKRRMEGESSIRKRRRVHANIEQTEAHCFEERTPRHVARTEMGSIPREESLEDKCYSSDDSNEFVQKLAPLQSAASNPFGDLCDLTSCWSMSAVQKATRLIHFLIHENREVAKETKEIFEEGLKSINDVQLMASPDRFERSSLLSDMFSNDFLGMRKCVWSILLAIGSISAVLTVGEDISRIGSIWKEAEDISHRYTHLYAKSFGIQERNHYPVPQRLEIARIIYLEYSRVFILRCGEDDVLQRLKHPSDTAYCVLPRLLSGIMSNVDHFRSKHAFRMPRAVRACYLRTGVAFMELVSRCFENFVHSGQVETKVSDISKLLNSTKKAILKFLSDPDGSVRLLAARLFPNLLKSLHFKTVVDMEMFVKSFLPEISSCVDNSVPCILHNSNVPSQESEEQAQAQWDLQKEEYDAHTRINDSFLPLGSTSKGCTSILTLTESVIAQESLIPFFYVELFERVSKNSRLGTVAYFGILRLCVAGGYASPKRLFQLFSRVTLHKWLCNRDAVDRMHTFPVFLLLDCNHHKEGILYDWIREHQSLLIPYFLIHESPENVSQLKLLSKLADDLETSTTVLLSNNVPSFSLIYPMHFVDSMHGAGRKLWKAIDACMEGRSKLLISRNNESVVERLLRSIHTKTIDGVELKGRIGKIEKDLGFVRDSTKLKPPLYDPLVIALSINQLYKANSELFIMGRDVLRGSIFAEVRIEKTGRVIANDFRAFAGECQKKSCTLLHVLLTVSRFLVGVPQHQPAQNRRDAFFCVGVIWRMISTSLLTKSVNERKIFYRLIARGFEHPETVRDAAWLLLDVQNKLPKLHYEQPNFSFSETELTSDSDVSEHLSQLNSSQERGLYELLKTVSPVMVALLISCDSVSTEEHKSIVSNALKGLVFCCEQLKAWSVILANGPFPKHKRVDHVQVLYLSAKKHLDAESGGEPLKKALNALNRFRGMFKVQKSLVSPAFLASLQEINSELNDQVLSQISRRLRAEAWFRSCGMECTTARRVSEVISCVIDVTYAINHGQVFCSDKLGCFRLNSHPFLQTDSSDAKLRNTILQESAKLLSKLGLLELCSTPIFSSQNFSPKIPARSLFGKYEDVGSGMQMSIFLLQDVLSSATPIRAQMAFRTLKEVLRTGEGRSILSSNRSRLEAMSFSLGIDRTMDSAKLEVDSALYDPLHGDRISIEVLPDITDVRLWSCGSNDFTNQYGQDKWLRTFCAAFARKCRSKEMQALSPVCFSSYEVSSRLMPYLLMDTICDLDTNRLSIVSDLLRRYVLNNPAAPISLRRLFIHALDVLCQIGLAVTFKDGVSHWFEKTNRAYPCYYVFEIPYDEVASSALSSRAYFSAIRFAQLHINQKEAHMELCRPPRPKREKSSISDENAFLEKEINDVRTSVIPVVHEAMNHVSEPDCKSSFNSGKDMTTLVANIATSNHEWASALGALEVPVEHFCSGSGAMDSKVEGCGSGSTSNQLSIDLRREVQKFRCFTGLGTLEVACAYWEDLRQRFAANFRGGSKLSLRKQHDYIAQLNDMRYAAAWKLQQWESPKPLNPQSYWAGGARSGGKGFHESIHEILRSVTTKRYDDVHETISNAMTSLVINLVADAASVSVTGVHRLASKLRVMDFLDGQASERHLPSPDVKFPIAIQSKTGTSINQEPGEQKFPYEKSTLRSIRLRDGHSGKNSSEDDSSNDRKDTELLLRLLNTQAPQDDDKFFPLMKAFDANSLTAEIPAVLFRCLGRKSDIALAAAASSARVFSEGGAGCWARAASCLGNTRTAFLDEAGRSKSAAWRLQNARLRWYSNHDACCRKQALDAVKSIITNDLYGKYEERRAVNECEEEVTYQCLTWTPISMADPLLQFLRVEACTLAAVWSLDMRTHEPMDLYRLYLESCLAAAQEAQSNRKLTARVHLAMASFANEQLRNIDIYKKSRTYEEIRLALKNTEDKVEEMKEVKEGGLITKKTVKANKRSRSSRSQMTSGNKLSRELDGLIYNEQRKARIERERLEKLNNTHRKWQLLACKHFAACLREGTSQDLKVAFRLVAIWLDSGAMRDTISAALINSTANSTPRNKCIDVPVSKLLPLAPQLISRLNASERLGINLFQSTLTDTITSMATDFPAHCLWQLLALTNSTRGCATDEKYSAFYKGDKDKKEAAEEILNNLQRQHGSTVLEMRLISDAYIALSEIDHASKQQGKRLDMKSYPVMRVGTLKNVPVPTVPLPICAGDHLEDIPHIHSFERYATVCAGLSRPLSIVCIGSDGHRYPQLVKGKDDLRGDAVMEQMFMLVNKLLQNDGQASTRNLSVRTYRIVPLSPFSGILQFVDNTMQLKDVLIEKSVTGGQRVVRKSLHERYRPRDLKHAAIQERAFKEYKYNGRRDIQRVQKFLKSAWPKFQPVFRHFFVEQWPDPQEWFQHQLNYSRSVAVMSIVGFILGIGDRHLSNILMDVRTAEVVHIDFGVAFEQGQLLPVPELMPFRLTRDIVDGFGIAGVEGVFRRSCEATLQILRQNKDVLLTVIDVLLHDPMFTWALTPVEILKEQQAMQEGSLKLFEDGGSSTSFPDSAADAVARKVDRDVNGSRDAQRAMSRISEKLDGLEGTERLSVEAHVARLIDEARAFHVLSSVFPGWSPWV